jgi:hypothetical protein
LPPLVTTSPLGTPPETSGVLGELGTRIVFGEDRLEPARSGGRITLGRWIGPCEDLAVEGIFLGIGPHASEFNASTPDSMILARPYQDVLFNTESSMLVSHPDLLVGGVRASTSSELQSAEFLLRRALLRQENGRVDLLVGYRFARLDDDLLVQQSSQWTATILQGTTQQLYDKFDASNCFNGGQLGLAFQERIGRWTVDFTSKVALGNTHSRVRIEGGTVATSPDGSTAMFNGGLLAQETNIGTYEWNRFTILPELGATLGYDFTPRLRGTFGYTLLYWSRVARAGEQVETSLSQLPPEAPAGHPMFDFVTNSFWAQGLNFGLELNF